MSLLQKALQRVQRREGPAMGFGAVAREQPRAMLAGVFCASSAAAASALEDGADLAVVRAASPRDGSLLAPRKGAIVGVLLDSLDEAGAAALSASGCDFIVAPLEATAAGAIDLEKLGHVPRVSPATDDDRLRALATMGFEAILVGEVAGPLTLGDQLALIRLAMLSSTPLMVQVAADASVAQLRALRDAGVGCVLLPEGASANDVRGLGEQLRAVPAPRKARRSGASDGALVPSAARGEDGGEDDDD